MKRKKEKEERIENIKKEIEDLKWCNEIDAQQQEFFGETSAIHVLRRRTIKIEELEKELNNLEK